MSIRLKLVSLLFLLVWTVGCDDGVDDIVPIKKVITPSTTFSYFAINKNGYFPATYDLIVRTLDSSKIDTIKVPAISGALPGYQWVNSKLLYQTINNIEQYDPQTKKSSVLIESPTIIGSFYANKDFIAYSDIQGYFLYDFANETVIDIKRIEDGDVRFPVISPDGQSVLFTESRSIEDENTGSSLSYLEYKVYEIKTKKTRDIVIPDDFAHRNYRLSWIYGSENLLYSQPSSLYLFNQATKELRMLTDENTVANRPNLSPDGTKISFLKSDQSQSGNNWQDFLTIYYLSGSTEEILFEKTTYETAWSPSSIRLLYSSAEGIFIYNFETATTQKLVNSTDTNQFIINIQWVH